jgi:hypothetical protein
MAIGGRKSEIDIFLGTHVDGEQIGVYTLGAGIVIGGLLFLFFGRSKLNSARSRAFRLMY